jgi:hypothetical protein
MLRYGMLPAARSHTRTALTLLLTLTQQEHMTDVHASVPCSTITFRT